MNQKRMGLSLSEIDREIGGNRGQENRGQGGRWCVLWRHFTGRYTLRSERRNTSRSISPTQFSSANTCAKRLTSPTAVVPPRNMSFSHVPKRVSITRSTG